MDLDRKIEDSDLVFIDLETTGLDVVTGDAICEIGAVKVRNREVTGKFHSLINPKKNIPKEAYKIHGISDETVKDAPYFEDVASNLVDFLAGCVIFAYNVSFDMGFISYYLRKFDYPDLDVPAIDLLLMARDVLNLPKYNLEAVAKHFQIDCSQGLHRALEDSLFAYKVFLNLIDIFKDKKIERLAEFLSLYGFNNEVSISRENEKIFFLNSAIDGKKNIKIRYFSPEDAKIEEEEVSPIKILLEDKHFCLWYQKGEESTSHIRLRRILEAKFD